MKPSLAIILLPVGMAALSDMAVGQQKHTFMKKYMNAIQEYIMTGHEKGWDHCDVLSSNPTSEGDPQMSMNLEKIETLNLKSAFKNSHCLLVHYDVSSESSLSTLIEFGWNTVNYVRLALVMEMHSSITLHMVKNTSNLPFLVAAVTEYGREQFLCPMVGEMSPRIENEMCNPSYLDYKNKTLRIGLTGLPPDFIRFPDGKIEGVNIRMMRMISERLKFTPKISLAEKLLAPLKLVNYHHSQLM